MLWFRFCKDQKENVLKPSVNDEWQADFLGERLHLSLIFSFNFFIILLTFCSQSVMYIFFIFKLGLLEASLNNCFSWQIINRVDKAHAYGSMTCSGRYSLSLPHYFNEMF